MDGVVAALPAALPHLIAHGLLGKLALGTKTGDELGALGLKRVDAGAGNRRHGKERVSVGLGALAQGRQRGACVGHVGLVGDDDLRALGKLGGIGQ